MRSRGFWSASARLAVGDQFSDTVPNGIAFELIPGRPAALPAPAPQRSDGEAKIPRNLALTNHRVSERLGEIGCDFATGHRDTCCGVPITTSTGLTPASGGNRDFPPPLSADALARSIALVP